MSKTVRKERPDFKEKRPNERRLKDRQRAEIREYYQSRG